MSFSFSTSGTPKEVIAEVGKQAANQPGVPSGFADSINDQLGQLPDDAQATLSAHGHTGYNPSMPSGHIILHAQIDYRVASPRPVAEIRNTDPEVQPGPERFPKGFDGDTPPGKSAGKAKANPDS
jgi:hypothetical protein